MIMILKFWFLKVDKGEFAIGKHNNTTSKSGQYVRQDWEGVW
jgi:hypothetical protein